MFYCGRTLILLRAASRLGESTGLWVDTPLWQRLSQPVSEYTHTHNDTMQRQLFPKDKTLHNTIKSIEFQRLLIGGPVAKVPFFQMVQISFLSVLIYSSRCEYDILKALIEEK